MTDLGKMSYFLGVEVMQSEKGIFISQGKYAREVLDRFGMSNSKAVGNPIVPCNKLTKEGNEAKVDAKKFKQMVGSLMYLTETRPDLMYAVSLVSRYMEAPDESHLQAVKRIMRYLKGTEKFGILYKRKGNGELIGYTDSDYAGDIDDRKSTSGYVFSLGSGVVSWASKKQPIVTLSTTEAEFVAAAFCASHAIWLERILRKLKQCQRKCLTLMCDNSSTIKLSKNPVMHGRCKHIDVRFHFLRDLTKEGKIELSYCDTSEQLADIITQPVKLDTFLTMRAKLGMCSIEEI